MYKVIFKDECKIACRSLNVINYMKTQHGVNISYDKVWRGCELALNSIWNTPNKVGKTFKYTSIYHNLNFI